MRFMTNNIYVYTFIIRMHLEINEAKTCLEVFFMNK